MNTIKIKTLPNSIRILAIPLPHLHSASVGVFVRTGSRNEALKSNGVSHFLEHMAFKGTKTRDVQAINLDAEILGIQSNAYTSKEMTAYYMSGLGKHAGHMLGMLADIVCESTHPQAEMSREREVIMQEAIEYEEDPQSISQTLLDEACYGTHPMGRPIIGTLANIERFDRDDILDYVREQYTGANIIIAASGNFDVEEFLREAEKAFSHLPAGVKHVLEKPVHLSMVKTRKVPQVSQVFAAISFPCASESEGHFPAVLAAVLFGGGMSSPLVDQVRERMGLAYQVGSSVDAGVDYGRFVIDAITTPDKIEAFLATTSRLLHEQALAIDPIHLERAKNQASVSVATQEQTIQCMDEYVEQLFNFNKILPVAAILQKIEDVTLEQVRNVFVELLKHRPAISMVGKLKAGRAKSLWPAQSGLSII